MLILTFAPRLVPNLLFENHDLITSLALISNKYALFLSPESAARVNIWNREAISSSDLHLIHEVVFRIRGPGPLSLSKFSINLQAGTGTFLLISICLLRVSLIYLPSHVYTLFLYPSSRQVPLSFCRSATDRHTMRRSKASERLRGNSYSSFSSKCIRSSQLFSIAPLPSRVDDYSQKEVEPFLHIFGFSLTSWACSFFEVTVVSSIKGVMLWVC